MREREFRQGSKASGNVGCFRRWVGALSSFLIFIEVQLLYNAVLVSTLWQSVSALCIHIPLLFWISFPFRPPQSTKYSSPCNMVGSHQLSTLYILSMVCMYETESPSSCHPPLSPCYPYACSYICVSISALYIRQSIPFFFQIPPICINRRYVFFSF